MVVWWCFCGGVCVVVWWCFGGVLVVFLWWLCGGVLVVFLWWCFCVGCVVVFFVMVFFPKAAAKGSFKKSVVIKDCLLRTVFKDCHQTSPKVLLK